METRVTIEVGSSDSDVSRPQKRARLMSSVPEVFAEMETDASPSQQQTPEQLRRTELIMLMEQALVQLGFHDACSQLAAESGVVYETPDVASFRRAILRGQFDQALVLLECLGITEDIAVKKAKFLILEQKFLEEIAAGRLASALGVLQRDIAGLRINQGRLHKLAGCLLCTTPEGIQQHLGWLSTQSFRNWEQLLRDVQDVVPPEVMVPEGRLESLLEQALGQQLMKMDARLLKHRPVSLIADYSFSLDQIPTQTTQVLTEHTGEVWHVAFSHDGLLLASASKDASAIVWELTAGRRHRRRHVLRGHQGALTFCAWSPDDRLLATCSLDTLVKLWDVAAGTCARTIDLHSGPATTAAWLPDGKGLLTSAEDKWIHLSYLETDKVVSWQSEGVNELVMLDDGRLLITPYGENKICQLLGVQNLGGTDCCIILTAGVSRPVARGRKHVLSVTLSLKVEIWTLPSDSEDQNWEPLILEEDCIVSAAVSRDGTRLLLNMATRAVHLWDVPGPDSKADSVQLQRLRGAKERQSRFIVRSCFGGYNDTYVLGGSEECKVFVWHSTSGELLASLEGHSGTVNSVSWNPGDDYMFASASDDKSIHIWGLDPNRSPNEASSIASRRSPAKML